MRIPRKLRAVLVTSLLIMAAGGLAVWLSLPTIERWAVGYHQKSVTRSLAAWGPEAAGITDDASAIYAAEMISYMAHFYLPGPGYRGPANVEAALERQRHESIELVVAALQRYTGLGYGTNIERWRKWAEGRKGSEPVGPANGSQPSRPDSNRTSAAAGPRR